MTTLQSFLDTVRARLDRATPGPYDSRVREFSNKALSEVWTEFGWYSQLPKDYREPTTELFANAPTDLARALKIIEVLREAIEDAEVETYPGDVAEMILNAALKRADKIAGEP